MNLEHALMLLSLSILTILGSVHLFYTFWGEKLMPRDKDLTERMKQVSPRISSQTNMWRAWVGFNASHSIGLILFGLIYSFLTIESPDVLFQSMFLTLLGFTVITSYLVLSKVYWFKIPLLGITVSFVCYLTSISVATL